eukprot:471734-Pleurochrysis_carterae.AAC.4
MLYQADTRMRVEPQRRRCARAGGRGLKKMRPKSGPARLMCAKADNMHTHLTFETAYVMQK